MAQKRPSSVGPSGRDPSRRHPNKDKVAEVRLNNWPWPMPDKSAPPDAVS